MAFSSWLKSNGKLIMSPGGNLILCDDCPCGIDCTKVDNGVPSCFEVTVAGVSNNTCTNCTNYNATYQMPRDLSNSNQFGSCFWEVLSDSVNVPLRAFPTFNCISNLRYATLSYVSQWRLSFGAAFHSPNAAIYFLSPSATGQLDGSGPNTFSLNPSSVNGACTGWPSNLTVVPCP